MKKEEPQDVIEILGAREHNLKNIDLVIPRNKLVVFTGLSGSGKSSLAFDTIFAEGQRRYIETFSAYARQFLGNLERPDVDKINGLSPVISIEQKTVSRSPRSTVGTITEIYDFLRLLYARIGTAYSYNSGEQMVKYSDEQIVELILAKYKGERLDVGVDGFEGAPKHLGPHIDAERRLQCRPAVDRRPRRPREGLRQSALGRALRRLLKNGVDDVFDSRHDRCGMSRARGLPLGADLVAVAFEQSLFPKQPDRQEVRDRLVGSAGKFRLP